MSDDFHRPTLTYPNGTYNATQVRLYGVSSNPSILYPKKSASIGNFHVSLPDTSVSSDEAKDAIKKIIDYANNNKEQSEEQTIRDIVSGKAKIPLPFPLPFPFPIPVGYSYQLALDMKKRFGAVVVSTATSFSEDFMSSGIIVGYSFEGHCYDLPKPKVMLIPALPHMVPADDCGYDLKNAPTAYNQGQTPKDWDNKYRVWIVDKLDECVEVEVNQGFVEQIVLEANLPGKRAPNMYAGRMMMGHRGGRLSE